VRVSPETQEEYGEYISLIPAWLKEKPINQITQADIEGWLEGQNYSRKRINNLLIPLRGAFRKAYRDGEIKVNPLQGLRIEARKTESKIDPFTRSEIALLSAGFCGRMWNFWAWTGLRSGEIAGLDWGDVDPSGDAVTVRRSVRMGREKGPKTQGQPSVIADKGGPSSIRQLDNPSRPTDKSGRLLGGPALKEMCDTVTPTSSAIRLRRGP
jgi:integrase